jgi:hypothetical protein
MQIARRRLRFSTASTLVGLAALLAATPAHSLTVTPTMNPADLADAFNASGLTINSVSITNGADGQFGTYVDFETLPIRFHDGVVLSSGLVSGTPAPADPILDYPQPSNDMATPGTAEFDAYGPSHIENFTSSNDVAALLVNFTLDDPGQIQFDFVFGSVEYPFWTGEYTDAFLVFLDGTANQITFDKNGNPVQVGVSFANLVTTDDQNTAFADPHGLIRSLTTTSALLSAGTHTLLFEVGDVNDHILDSAAFITNLRTGEDDEGTEETPEPGTWTLLAAGLACVGLGRPRKGRTV